MKQLISYLLVFFLLIALVGCAENTPAPKSPVSFFYPAIDVVYDGRTEVIQPEIREGAGFEEDIAGLLNLYLQGPVSEGFRSPFPSRMTVTRYSSTANTAILELSNEFSQLVGIELTLACASIAKTLFELTQFERVQIYATDAQLESQASITLERDDLYFIDIPIHETNTRESAEVSQQ